jgi:hypothetical protein
VALTLIVALLAQGCILERKTILDVYRPVFEVGEDQTQLVSVLSFGFSYCIPPGSLGLDVKFDEFDANLTQLAVLAAVYSATNTLLFSQLFPLTGKNGKFKGGFTLGFSSLFCIDPGSRLEWSVTPIGGAILAGASMTSKLRYQAE